MEFWLALIIISSIFIYLLFLGRIYIEITYKRNKENDYISITVYSLRKLLHYTMQVPMIRILEDSEDIQLQAAVQTVKNYKNTNPNKEERFLNKTEKLVKAKPRKIKHILKKFHHYAKMYCAFIEKILKLVVCEKFYCKTKYGSEDAALTGIFVGLLWAFKSLLVNRLKRKVFTIKELDIEVNPIFGYNQLEVDFQCIFSIKLGNVIKAITSIYNIKQ